MESALEAGEYVDAPEAPDMCGLKPMVFKHHADTLAAAGLLHIGDWADSRHYKVSGDGAGWLMDRGLMPR